MPEEAEATTACAQEVMTQMMMPTVHAVHVGLHLVVEVLRTPEFCQSDEPQALSVLLPVPCRVANH